jgi:transposase
MRFKLRYAIRRADCPRCGVIVERVPWADPGSCFTHDFEEQVAYLAQKTDKTTIVDTLRVAWRTVGAIVARVVERYRPGEPLDGLTRIGVDELSFRKHHSYVTVVIDHMSERVVWVRPGKSADTLGEFFKELGPERCEKLESVTMDMSPAYIAAVKAAVPAVQVIFDRFHVQRLAHDALDEVRRAEVRASESVEEGRALKRTRFILHKNPWNLTNMENQKLTEVQRVNGPLYRAYLMKETLAEILDGRDVDVARTKLTEWISWAAHSHLKPFEKLARTVKGHFEGILAYVETRLSNGRTEGMNGKIRTITRRSFGFHSASSLIGLIYLCCSGISLLPVLKFVPIKTAVAPAS